MNTRWLSASVMVILLASCGGGSGGANSDEGQGNGGVNSPAQPGSPNIPPPITPPTTPPITPPTNGGFSVNPAQTIAPADGVGIGASVELTVFGSGIENAELLPATATSPVFLRLTPSADGSRATGTFDTRVLPNGKPISLRIEAYNVAPGQSGAIGATAMAPRTWTVNHGLNWRNGDLHIVSGIPEIYPLSRDLAFLDDWLSISDEVHMADYADDATWFAFMDQIDNYIPNHVAMTQAGIFFAGTRDSCIFDRAFPACRFYVENLRGLILN